jgi:hypothetical protein
VNVGKAKKIIRTIIAVTISFEKEISPGFPP